MIKAQLINDNFEIKENQLNNETYIKSIICHLIINDDDKIIFSDEIYPLLLYKELKQIKYTIKENKSNIFIKQIKLCFDNKTNIWTINNFNKEYNENEVLSFIDNYTSLIEKHKIVKCVDMNNLIPLISEIISSDKEVVFTPYGSSMLPLLKGGKSVIILKKFDGKIKKNDLPLYKREDGKYILHRVIKINKDNTFNARGDSLIVNEKNINISSIIAITSQYKRKDKFKKIHCFSYNLYSAIWNITFPLRYLIIKFYRMIRKIFK